MNRTIVSLSMTAAMIVCGATAAHAEDQEVSVEDFSTVEGLTPEQLETIEALESDVLIDVPGLTPTKTSDGISNPSLEAVRTRRASIRTGGPLMWSRDTVDFGYDFRRVTFTSADQSAGWIWPNIARTNGITKWYDTGTNDRFRGKHTLGAGVPTPWGDVKIYSKSYTHYISVHHNGAWNATN